MTHSLEIDDITIYQEMLTHPALFSLNNPEKIVIMGDVNCRLLMEVIKHRNLTEIWAVSQYPATEPPVDSRVFYHKTTPILPEAFFDVILVADEAQEKLFSHYFEVLNNNGILVQLSESPFNVVALREIQIHLQLAGFRDVNIMSFPQPTFKTGWRAALMAKKYGNLSRVKEKAIFNKNFATRYYNLDVHKASLVLPEFMREALTT